MSTIDKGRIPQFNIDAILTLLFYMLALASIISYFVWLDSYPRLFLYLGVAAGVVRLVYYIMRFVRNK